MVCALTTTETLAPRGRCPGRRHLLGLRRDGAGSRRAVIGTARSCNLTPQLDQQSINRVRQLAAAIQPAAQPALNSLASIVASLFVSTMVQSIM